MQNIQIYWCSSVCKLVMLSKHYYYYCNSVQHVLINKLIKLWITIAGFWCVELKIWCFSTSVRIHTSISSSVVGIKLHSRIAHEQQLGVGVRKIKDRIVFIKNYYSSLNFSLKWCRIKTIVDIYSHLLFFFALISWYFFISIILNVIRSFQLNNLKRQKRELKGPSEMKHDTSDREMQDLGFLYKKEFLSSILFSLVFITNLDMPWS